MSEDDIQSKLSMNCIISKYVLTIKHRTATKSTKRQIITITSQEE